MQPLITLTTVNNHTIHRTMLKSDTISLNLSSWFQPSVTRTIIVSGDVYQRGICDASQPLLQSFLSAVGENFLLCCSFFASFVSHLWIGDTGFQFGQRRTLELHRVTSERFDGTLMTQISHLIVLENSSAVHFTSECRKVAFIEKSHVQCFSVELFL